MKLDKNHVFTL